METTEVQAAEVIDGLKSAEKISKARTFGVAEVIISEVMPTLLLKLLVKRIKLLQMLWS